MAPYNFSSSYAPVTMVADPSTECIGVSPPMRHEIDKILLSERLNLDVQRTQGNQGIMLICVWEILWEDT